MKKFILLALAVLSYAAAFAQGGYDPENPGDPNPYRKLTVKASPAAGGRAEVYPGSKQFKVGENVECRAYANQYYEFVHWLKNGEIVSENWQYSFSMPDENVEMVAVFEENYNPGNPGDPEETKTTHRVTLLSTPGKGGHFNSSVFRMAEGDSTYVYAYPNEGYRFEEWQLNGVLVSTKNPMKIKMGEKNLQYTARFSYNPVDPGDPSVNIFNPTSGQMVIDRFEPGYLSSAVSRLLGEGHSHSDIQSLVVCGRMDAGDYGVMRLLKGCQRLDLSRTNGHSAIPSNAFQSLKALNELVLPSCVNSIENRAFEGCLSLSVVSCHAVIPPGIGKYVFNGVDKNLVVKVPVQSIDLYKNAEGWKAYTILPIDSDVYSITATLPKDAGDGRYKNMNIELLNVSNGLRYKYLITDKTEYVFGNLLSKTKHTLSVKNGNNDVLGEMADLEITDKNLTVAFESLRQPKTVSVKVTSPEGKDMTPEVVVKWQNGAGDIMHQGAVLSGVLENTAVSYTVILPRELQSLYLQPKPQTVTVGDADYHECKLEAISKCKLQGKILDKDGNPVANALVAVSQKVNGSYANSQTAHTGKEGTYSLEVADVPVKVLISATGYVGQTKELETANTGVGDVVLEKASGITIFPTYDFKKSTGNDGDKDVGNDSGSYIDATNLAYRICGTDGKEISGCVYQQGSIILPEEMETGGSVVITAYSKNGQFGEVSETLTLDSKSVYVTLPVVEYGGIDVKCSDEEDTGSICIVFDGTGKQVRKSGFVNGDATFRTLPDGDYTLVTMKKSALMGSVQNLASLKETPLAEGSDYVLSTTSVASGRISETGISTVPALDETKLYYTDSKETYFMSNKQQQTIGNYVALKAKMTIKDEYAGSVDAATLVVDLPKGCEFVDNSVISGAGYMGYELTGNRVSIPVQRLSDAVRFCIVPVEAGECRPSAFIKLVVDNKEILQPIGSAFFEAENFSLSAPGKTAKTEIALRGTATPDSEVQIYDNGRLVGSTYCMPNGEWSTKVTLYKPYTSSLHEIYGLVLTQDGKRLLTDTKTVDYNQLYIDLSKVTMSYRDTNIVFDHINGKNSDHSYSYVPGYTDFSFTADFNDNNPEKIKNVIIKVLASDGSVRSLTADYNSVTRNWTAKTKYSNTNAIPVNATALFDIVTTEEKYCEERYADQEDAIESLIETFEKQLKESNFKITSETEDVIEGELNLENGFNGVYSVKILASDDSRLKTDDYCIISSDNVDYRMNYSLENNTATMLIWSDKDAFEIKLTDSSSNNDTRGWIADAANNAYRFIQRLLGNGDIVEFYDDLHYWQQQYGAFNADLNKLHQMIYQVLYAKCSDGKYKLYSSNLFKYEGKNYELISEGKSIDIHLKGRIDLYNIQIVELVVLRSLLKGVSVLWAYLTKGGSLNMTMGNILTTGFFKEWGISWIQSQVENYLGQLGEYISGATEARNMSEYLWKWYPAKRNELIGKYVELKSEIIKNYEKCPGDKDEDDEDEDDDDKGKRHGKVNFPTPPITPSIDPSGYVYEAVPSNRIAGVTATAYFKQQTEDKYGDITETAVVWDAAPFGQENPLITDAKGMYAWDVPAGMWQVRFEKEGYETAQSAWLPVPPPQLDVNIAMVQSKQPEVKTVHAYHDGVTFEFDKFMLPSTLTIGNIKLTQEGTVVNGEVKALNMELDANGNSFCSKMEFKPATELKEGEVTVFVSKAVKSYANIGMGDDFTQTFKIEPRISGIDIDNEIEVASGSTVKVSASVSPGAAAKGKTVRIESSNAMIATVSSDKTEADGDGNISFDVTGLIEGKTEIRLDIEENDVSAYVKVNVVAPRGINQVSTPYASVESGEIEEGTEVYLHCDTEDAVIYYTLDGSCPCDLDRLRYDGSPLKIEKDCKLRIMAEAEGMTDSEIAEYKYTVTSSGIDDIVIDGELKIFPLPMGDNLNITNGDNAIDWVTIHNMSGAVMLRSGKSENGVSLNVGFLAPGVYILNVRSAGQTITKKVMKL